jgi:arylsulfatase A-like enzyme
MELPPSFRIGNRKLPPHALALHAARDDGTRNGNSPAAFAVNEQETREAIALTFGMIAMIDDGMTRILKRLDELGLADNTVIVFTSDHGDLMGDHQLMLKGAYAYQGLIRVPFIWVEPDAPSPRRTGALYSTLDLAATFLDRARLAPYNGIQGKSLLRTLKDERWRITVYRNVPWGELYDLAADPHELHNLWDEPASAGIRQELTERLVQKMMEMAERSPRPTHTA